MLNNLESTSICDKKYKIVFLGNMSVGKSSIIQKFINNRFDENRQDTVGIDFLSKNLQCSGNIFRLILWDTAGQEKFRSLIPAYLRDANAAVFVYDVTCQESFGGLGEWIQMFNNYKRKDSVMMIAGNKIDLKQKRKISKQIANNFSMSNNAKFKEISAKSGQNIQTLFDTLIESLQQIEEKESEIEEQNIESQKRISENGIDNVNNNNTRSKILRKKSSRADSLSTDKIKGKKTFCCYV